MSNAIALVDWKSMPDGQDKYHAYLASREWAVKKTAVRQRSGGTCERCKKGVAKQCHHLTYIRLYNERMEDLADWCPGCHEWNHDKTRENPIEYWKHANDDLVPGDAEVFGTTRSSGVRCVQCPACQGEMDSVHIVISSVKRKAGQYQGSVDIPYWCECGYCFTWRLETINGTTYFSIIRTDEDKVRQSELIG